MDYSPAPVPDQNHEIPKQMKFLDIYTGVSALILIVTFFIVITRFRMWHTNKFLMKIPVLVNHTVSNWIGQAITIVLIYENTINDLYFIWAVILIIAYDNAFTSSCYSLLEKDAERKSREFTFLSNCVLAGVLIAINKGHEFYVALLALWSLLVAKFILRIMSYMRGERAYGIENINLVAEYMRSEHGLTQPSDAIDPTSMKGYKYLVMGEEKIKSNIEAPDYFPEIELTDDVITVERVWSCEKGLLHRLVDTDGRLKDVCLSFALFKLLRRQHFGCPAAEASQTKTGHLIFDGLLSVKAKPDKERVFRVIKMELGFLRDLIFTRYPIGFAFGFPVFPLVFLGGKLSATIFIAIKVFNLGKNNDHNIYYLWDNKVNLDYPLTYALLILITIMELFEVLTYVFCDWTTVIMICRNVKCNSSIVTNERASSDANLKEAQPWLYVYKVLALFCKPKFFLSVKNNLGQYSLLRNSNKTYLESSRRWYSLISTCGVSKIEVPLKKGKSVKLSRDVKEAIFDTLVESRGDLTKSMPVLRRNWASVYEGLKWTLNLRTPLHTIIVWHVATSLCDYPLVYVRGNKDHKVATHLSNYCAYLVAFLPDLLPLNSNLVKSMFQKIVEETSQFFGGANLKAKYDILMSSADGGQKIIHQGSELGRYLIKEIPDDAQRWKLMADLWSEYILYLAPKGSTRVHMEQLGNGSEFITHLWALLYHAGITGGTNSSEEFQP